jgi:hypothetical protein
MCSEHRSKVHQRLVVRNWWIFKYDFWREGAAKEFPVVELHGDMPGDEVEGTGAGISGESSSK